MDTFCLVALNSQYVHTNLAVRLIKNTDQYNNTCIIEHTINNQMDLVLEDIVLKSPTCVIFSCYIWNIEYVMLLSSSIKKILPDSSIVLAGPEVNYNGKEILRQHSYIDIVCAGPGEIIFPQLQDGIMLRDLVPVEGICYRQENEIRENPIVSKYDINTQKFPYYDIEDVKDRILYFETSRGCPYNCSYCISSITKGVDFMSIEKVEESFEIFFRHNVNQVKLVDRTFNYPLKRAVQIIEIMLKLKDKYPDSTTSFHCELNPLLINDEFVKLLKKAPDNFLQFEIGVQSTNPHTLKEINRDFNLEKQYENISKLTELKNIKVFVDLIAGLPHETFDIFKKSFNDTYLLGAGGLHLGFLKVLKGSEMEKNAENHGIEYSSYAPYKILRSTYISFEELCRLEKIESLVDTYYNSGRFVNSLRYALAFFDSPFSFYDHFRMYLEKRYYFIKPHKFITYYDFLNDFLSEIGAVNTEYLENLLLHDYACHSKPRSYPKCIKSAYSEKKKKAVREFFSNNEYIEKYLPHLAGMPSGSISRICNIEIFNFDILEKEISEKDIVVLYDYKDKTKVYKVL
ncbi:MAG: B12-binding domain-containing radical SAM protein [Clostridia bacterium]|nr:B12-binding domain-containing radical SAM protein [Clostridia bacterium]